MSRHDYPEDVRPVDAVLGDDGDAPGIAQELTTDDIDDVALDAAYSVAERRRQLMVLLEELRARTSADTQDDMTEIANHLADRLASLRNPLESQADLGSTGMSPEDRSDDDDPADHIDDRKEGDDEA